ncbi:MAG: DNA ligase [Candidatus Scalindua sp.]
MANMVKKSVVMKRYSIISLARFSLFIVVSFLSLFTPANPIFSETLLHDGKQQKVPVMLAHRWDEETDIKGWWMSEKLDGVRGYWTGKEMVSRAGNSFHAPEWYTRNFPSIPLDGELWTGRGQFSELVSIVRRSPDKKRRGQEGADTDWRKVRYFIFDAPQIEGGFEKRLEFAHRWFREHPNQFVEMMEQQICEGEEHLRRKLREIELLGGEGLMLRRPDSPYTIGRSYNLLKVKTYEDTEATVISRLPGSGRNAGRLGSLLVELPNGIQFKIGTGFSDQERDNPPPVGSIITFKYYGFYKSGIPKFASFLRVREEF